MQWQIKKVVRDHFVYFNPFFSRNSSKSDVLKGSDRLRKMITYMMLLSSAAILLSACTTPAPVMPTPQTKQPVQQTASTQERSRASQIAKTIEQSMDPVDQFKKDQALTHEGVGQPTNWTNPNSGNQYTITTNKVFTQGAQDCRSYTNIAVIKGQQYRAQSTACHSASGNWQLIANEK